jgi:chromosome segregation ATPase
MDLDKIQIDNDYENKEIPDAAEYVTRLNELDNGIDILLDNFKHIYVTSKLHPNNEMYQQQYQTMINSLSELLSKLYSVSNELEINVNDINNELLKINKNIKEERKKNKELKKRLGIIEHESNAASEMIYDYVNIYDYRYLRNFALFIGIFLCISTIKKTYMEK